MEIRTFTEEDLPAIHKFGFEAYPKRRDYYGSIIDFFLKGRIGGYTGGIGLFDGEKLCGQQLYSACSFWYDGKKYDAGWCFDLIIREDLRKEAWGLDLIVDSMRIFPYACGTGAGPNSKPISLKLGMKVLGEIRKYVGVSSKIKAPFLILLPGRSFPTTVNEFRLIENPSEIKEKEYYNRYLIESGRDMEFLKWRFFTEGFKDYKFYQKENGDFFVVRIISHKGIKMLALIDFRCSMDSKGSFKDILKSVKAISNHIRVPFILVGSTHKVSDKVLEDAGFKSIGSPRAFMTAGRNKVKPDKSRVQERDYVLITLADCDGEVSWK
ncbi:MAG: hypothetical protein K2N03_08665 [Muribaculaceae bacterium]|nr:hypothetical protein [Muribaculaceae bacterium]